MNLTFDNQFLQKLPGDPEESERRRQVYHASWSRQQPTPVRAPRLLAHSREVAAFLGVSEQDVASPEFAQIFAGNRLLDGMEPFAACYGGHQFGHWAGQLGDGRAISLGETINAAGQRWELQLKGAGPTPYARTADGRAVLRSSLREFLCSEAMFHLGVPTTRALSLVATGEFVVRDMFYDGHPQPEKGAVVCRVAPSFLRFGNFELPSSRDDIALLEKLVDFTVARDFPEIDEGSPEERRTRWFHQVCARTAVMVAHWMRVGFVHGVMNTDNMSILGLTIDYGPYGWIDNYDPDWTPNTTDSQRKRYRFANQHPVAGWNLARLAEALAPLFASVEPLEEGLDLYMKVFQEHDSRNRQGKFGLFEAREEDPILIEEAFRLLARSEVDMTLFFRALPALAGDGHPLAVLEPALYDSARAARFSEEWLDWQNRYRARLELETLPAAEREKRMNAVNPLYVPRNYLAQQAIDKADAGDISMLEDLLETFRQPYTEQPGREAFAGRRPDWAREKAGCSMLSCSS